MNPQTSRESATDALPSVFLSYSRRDDPAFIRAVYDHLTAVGIDVWFDKEDMPNRGLTFHQEIRDSIHERDRTLLILGPAAVESEYVREEWQYALAAGKVVTPVLRGITHDRVPPELRAVHIPDAGDVMLIDPDLSEIERVVSQPPAVLGGLYGVRKLPPHFRPRADEFSILYGRFALDRVGEIDVPPEKKIVFLHGMGGLGKSVLATALAHSPGIRRQFGSGVIWLDFEREHRDPLPQVKRVNWTLGVAPRYLGLAEAQKALSDALADASILLILDNVWWPEQASPFRESLGPRCQMLVTSRDSTIGARLGAQIQEVSLMEPAQSLALLADWVESDPSALPEAAQEVADECGNLPFALALAGAVASDGTPWSDLLEALREADLTFLEARLEGYEQYSNLLRAQQVGLDHLEESGDPSLASAATMYRQISPFHWSGGVPEAALVTRWLHNEGVTEPRARRVISTLARKALLRVEGEVPSRRVFLHDLQQDFLVASAGDAEQEHQFLLDAYELRYPKGPLTVDDDGYYHDNLLHHLCEARTPERMHDLLSLETGQNGNAWWEARMALGQAFGYHQDLERAWRHASDLAVANPGRPDPRALALAGRYALMVGSVRAALANVPTALIAQLLERGVWTAPQALASARWSRADSARVVGLVTALSALDDPSRQEVVDETLAMVRRFAETQDRCKALVELLPYMAPATAAATRDAILSQCDEGARSWHIFWRMWQLNVGEDEWIENVIDAIGAQDPASAAWGIARIAEDVPEAYLPQLTSLSRDLPPARRAEAILALIPHVPDEDRHQLAIEAYEAALEEENVRIRLPLVADVAKWLPEDRRNEAVRRVEAEFESLVESAQVQALVAVLPFAERSRVDLERRVLALLHDGRSRVASGLVRDRGLAWLEDEDPVLFGTVLNALVSVAEERGGTELVHGLLPHLRDEEARTLLEVELKRTQGIDDFPARIESSSRLLAQLDQAERVPLTDRLFEVILEQGPSKLATWDLGDILRIGNPDQLRSLAEKAESADHAADLAFGLTVAYAHAGMWDEVPTVFNKIDGLGLRGMVFGAFPAEMPAERAISFLGWIARIRRAELGAQVLPALLTSLDGDELGFAIEVGLQAAALIDPGSDLHRLLAALMPHLPCGELARATELCQSAEESSLESEYMFQRLAERSFTCGHPDDARKHLDRITWSEYRANALLAWARASEGEVSQRYLDLAETEASGAFPSGQVEILVGLAASARGDERKRLLDKALVVATHVPADAEEMTIGPTREEETVAALTVVAPHLDEPHRSRHLLDAWQRAHELSPWRRSDSLRSLSTHLAELKPDQLIHDWLEQTWSQASARRPVLETIGALAEVIHRLGGSDAVTQLTVAIEDVSRWWPDA